jgi:hypothetical protein
MLGLLGFQHQVIRASSSDLLVFLVKRVLEVLEFNVVPSQ